ncbi:Ig-like domain-containing protein, partial [Nemorincola caseinilytica]|uniref:Ig-like domain-containing protein n=1 Tax=Nemorincola caseinilytica TaxID=2054315 RepID=UPI0031E87B50
MRRIFPLLYLMLFVSFAGKAQTYLMPGSATTATYTVCAGSFYDDGGSSSNYSCCSFQAITTFYPAVPGKKVRLVFNSFSVENSYDWMRIFNGNSTGATQIGGNYYSSPGTITSSAADGSLTVQFRSDVSNTYAGWDATISLTGTATNPITAQPAAGGSTVCIGGSGPSVSVTATATVLGPNTYQWYRNGTTNSNTGGTIIAGATNASYAPSPIVVGTNYFYCVVTNSCGDAFASNTTSVVAIAKPTVASITPSSSSVCVGSPISFTAGAVSAAGAGSLVSYNWTGPNGFSAATTANNTSFTPASTAAGGVYSLTVSYSVSGCTSSPAVVTSPSVTVNNPPTAITGGGIICQNATTTLNSTPSGGTWATASSNATIFSGTGVATGINAGTAIVTYTAPTNCYTTYTLTVNPLPTATVTPTSAAVCLGNGTALSVNSPTPQVSLLSQNFNSGLSGWTITPGAGTAAQFWQIVTPPGTASFNGDGTQYLQAAAMLSPTSSVITSPSFSTTGGYASVALKFNQVLYSQSPDNAASIEYSANGGPWTQIVNQTPSPGIINDNGNDGNWSAANPEFNMALPAGALNVSDLKLRWVYNSQALYWLIDNITVTGVFPAPTLTWTGPGTIVCGSCATATVTPTATGTNNYNIAVTSSTGCITNTSVTVTANPLPAAISGNLTVCEGMSNTLSSTAGGTWNSSDPSKATIGSGTGALNGIAAGTTTISYTFTTTGCRTTAVATVLAAPAAISPATASVCIGSSLDLDCSTLNGVWSTSNASVATVDVSTGLVNGAGVGTANITYTVPNGCISVRSVTVNPLPAAITGASAVCVDASTTFSDSDPLGTWSSANTAIASVDPSTGSVTGVGAGNTVISYILPTGCIAIKGILVNPQPNAISGVDAVCQGATTVMSSSSGSATWSSSAPGVAAIDGSGIVTTNT